MKTKVTLLSCLVCAAVSGQEQDNTNGPAEVKVRSWLYPLGISRIAEASIVFLNQLRTANTTNETRTNLRGHTSILPKESLYNTLAQHNREEQKEDDETTRRYLYSVKKNEKRIEKLKNEIKRTKKKMKGCVGEALKTLKNSLNDLKNQLQKQKQQLRRKKNQLKKKNQQAKKNKNQQGTKSNEAPCSRTTKGVCAIFNIFGSDARNGSTNGNSGGKNGINGNGSQQETKTIKDVDGESLESTSTTSTELTSTTSTELTSATATMPPSPTYEWIKLDDRQHRAYDYFGRSVAIDENTIVVGAPSDDEIAWQNKGYVSVFYQEASNEWNLQQDLPTPEGVEEGDLFGYSVAIHGNVIVAGAPRAGIVQVYTRVEPGEAFTKSGSPIESHKMGNFGESVAVFGNTVVVGAPTENHSGRIKAGSAYVYVRNGNEWDFEEELIADSPSTHEYFGASVAIYHDTIIVGMPGHGSFEKGGAQVFHRDGFSWEYDDAPISTGVGTGEGHYGRYVDIHREIVAVGGDLVAPRVFERDYTDAWVPLGYSSLTTGGTAVAVDHDQGNNDDILVVGGYNKVKIFYHEDNQWIENEDGNVPTEPSSVEDGDAFGASVAISEGYIVAGGPMTHAGGLSPVGDVFVMDLNVDTSSQNGDGDGGDEYDYGED